MDGRCCSDNYLWFWCPVSVASFDICFFYEEFENVPEVIEVNVGQHIFNVSIVVKFISEQEPIFNESEMRSESDDESKGWEFWHNEDAQSPQNDIGDSQRNRENR